MAKLGSISCALRKCEAASSYSKLWSCARPCRKSDCAAGEPELANATSPTVGDWARRAEEQRRMLRTVRSRFIGRRLVVSGGIYHRGHRVHRKEKDEERFLAPFGMTAS